MDSRTDVSKVKAVAAGRWPEILAAVGRLDPALLDGKHHPCPKCGGSDRFRLIDEAAGAVFCNHCFNTANGDGLAAICWHRGIDFKTACREVAAHLGMNGKPPARSGAVPTTLKETKPELADPDVLNRAYGLLLSRLSLSSGHRDALRRRGLTDEAIDGSGYRSWDPADPHRSVSAVTLELGTAIEGVPGFDRGRLAAPAGLLIPVRDLTRRIVALKIRPDEVGNGPKYLYVSAAKQGGPSPGAPPHVPLGIVGPVEVVRITEGELKADVATTLSDVPTISFPGASTWRHVVPVVAELVGGNPPGLRRVRVAIDADAQTNPAVSTALLALVEFFDSEGYSVELELWSVDDGKGIDDLLATGKTPEVLTGDAVLAAAREIKASSELYGLPKVLVEPTRPVVVVPSEKDVDDLAKIDVLALCIASGRGKWAAQHAEFLRGRRVVILVHNDEGARESADQAACILHAIASSLRIAELPENGNISDWLAAGGTKKALIELCGAAQVWQPSSRWPELVPFDVVEPPEFPVDLLPPVLRDFVTAEALATQTPLDLPGMLCLAVVSACIARRVVVEARTGWREPTNLYVAVLLGPGNRKSAVFSDVTRPLRDLESELIDEARPKWAQEHSERRQALAKLKKLENAAAGEGGQEKGLAASKLAVELSERPEPVLPRLLVDDVTTQKLGMMLAEQGGRLASMSPEGNVFDVMAGMYSRTGHRNLTNT